jgi:hypothetical protein
MQNGRIAQVAGNDLSSWRKNAQSKGCCRHHALVESEAKVI